MTLALTVDDKFMTPCRNTGRTDKKNLLTVRVAGFCKGHRSKPELGRFHRPECCLTRLAMGGRRGDAADVRLNQSPVWEVVSLRAAVQAD